MLKLKQSWVQFQHHPNIRSRWSSVK